ncbi:C39 family peptidase [Paenibacillus daejeonensis]|uniref:C39 family peptidase n=1 Tax=Paenibacillus daejeonensis TaxID=135193 RepID=UPI0003622CEF|nr:C39 family peptidase [Paenibacillus daejeonensis]
MKKKWMLLFLVWLIAITPITAYAEVTENSKIEFSQYDKAVEVAAQYVQVVQNNTEDWPHAQVNYEFPLFDFNERMTAHLFSVSSLGVDSGYLIVSVDDNPVVLESTREGSHPYSKSSENLHYYVGATMHYSQVDKEHIIDHRQGKVINSNELKGSGTLQGMETNKSLAPNKDSVLSFSSTADIRPFTIISYSRRIISGVPDYTNVIGCSPTSFSNIVKYWDNNGYPNLVQSTTTSTTLIQVMASYMNTLSNGTTNWNDRVTGMQNFWSDRGYSVAVTRISANFSTHKTEINNGRPDIINTVNDPTYSDHDMTGVGYEEYQDTNQNLAWFRYVIVHDTWSSTGTDVYLYLPQLSWNETVKVVPN